MRTGGNDNAVRVWSASKLGAGAQELQGHGAAVKALAWSPHARGRLATGGGTADRSIKIWDAARGLRLSTVDTGSQVCALAWSSAEDALVSAHGYSLNQILIWRLPELARDGVLAGHGKRVLYLVWFGVLERTFHAIDATRSVRRLCRPTAASPSRARATSRSGSGPASGGGGAGPGDSWSAAGFDNVRNLMPAARGGA